MSKDNNVFEELARLAGSALSTASDMKKDISTLMQQQIESFIKGMHFVTKEELEAIKAVLEQHSKDIAALKEGRSTDTDTDKNNSI